MNESLVDGPSPSVATCSEEAETDDGVSQSEVNHAFDQLIVAIAAKLQRESSEVTEGIVQSLRARFEALRGLPVLPQLRRYIADAAAATGEPDAIVYTVINALTKDMERLKRKHCPPTVAVVGSTRQKKEAEEITRRLLGYLHKISKEIKLESEKEIDLTKEIDSDDDESKNPWLKLNYLQKKAAFILKKLRKISGRYSSCGRYDIERKTTYTGSGYDAIDAQITRLVQGPARDSKFSNMSRCRALHPSVKFAVPSFHEVLDVVHSENERNSLGIKKEYLLASKIHREVGLRLKYKDVMDRKLFVSDLIKGTYGEVEEDPHVEEVESNDPCCSTTEQASEEFIKAVAKSVGNSLPPSVDSLLKQDNEESTSSSSTPLSVEKNEADQESEPPIAPSLPEVKVEEDQDFSPTEPSATSEVRKNSSLSNDKDSVAKEEKHCMTTNDSSTDVEAAEQTMVEGDWPKPTQMKEEPAAEEVSCEHVKLKEESAAEEVSCERVLLKEEGAINGCSSGRVEVVGGFVGKEEKEKTVEDGPSSSSHHGKIGGVDTDRVESLVSITENAQVDSTVLTRALIPTPMPPLNCMPVYVRPTVRADQLTSPDDRLMYLINQMFQRPRSNQCQQAAAVRRRPLLKLSHPAAANNGVSNMSHVKLLLQPVRSDPPVKKFKPTIQGAAENKKAVAKNSSSNVEVIDLTMESDEEGHD